MSKKQTVVLQHGALAESAATKPASSKPPASSTTRSSHRRSAEHTDEAPIPMEVEQPAETATTPVGPSSVVPPTSTLASSGAVVPVGHGRPSIRPTSKLCATSAIARSLAEKAARARKTTEVAQARVTAKASRDAAVAGCEAAVASRNAVVASRNAAVASRVTVPTKRRMSQSKPSSKSTPTTSSTPKKTMFAVTFNGGRPTTSRGARDDTVRPPESRAQHDDTIGRYPVVEEEAEELSIRVPDDYDNELEMIFGDKSISSETEEQSIESYSSASSSDRSPSPPPKRPALAPLKFTSCHHHHTARQARRSQHQLGQPHDASSQLAVSMARQDSQRALKPEP